MQEQSSIAQEEIKTLNAHISELESKLLYTNPSITEANEKSVDNTTQKMFILGTQQYTGLASAVIRFRENRKYGKYQVSAVTKPFAQTAEVLKCQNLKLDSKDKLVLCIGENDIDPIITTSELYSILKTFQNNTVIVVNVVDSRHLNTKRLNILLKQICGKFTNCHFLENKYIYKSLLYDICYSLNLLIDSLDYNRDFLDPSVIKKHIQHNNRYTHTHRKEDTTQKTRLDAHEITLNLLLLESTPRLKQTHILDYYPKIHTSNIVYHKQGNDQFFRREK